MSLITRCPACGTMFKVVPDQLRISQGWVRCGHCAEVFDASAYLQGRDAVPPQATAPVDTPAPEMPAPVAVPPAPVPAPAFEEPALQAWEPESVLQAAATPEAPIAPPAEDAATPSEYDPFAEMASDPQPAAEVEEAEAPADTDLSSLSFVQQAQRKAFWRRPAVRIALALLVLMLGGLLAAQYAVYDRDRLAAAEPALKPLLEALCDPVRCQVGPPRQIEAIVIDASAFNKLRGDAYRLSFTLKNQSAMDVAIPAVELTLTDSQDQPVIRRVLQPREMGATSAVIAPASDWSGSLAISVASGGNTARIAGYRLLAFYP
ncbi:MAG: DUF3426 domain-containing protein [Ramlibacter sp.]